MARSSVALISTSLVIQLALCPFGLCLAASSVVFAVSTSSIASAQTNVPSCHTDRSRQAESGLKTHDANGTPATIESSSAGVLPGPAVGFPRKGFGEDRPNQERLACCVEQLVLEVVPFSAISVEPILSDVLVARILNGFAVPLLNRAGVFAEIYSSGLSPPAETALYLRHQTFLI